MSRASAPGKIILFGEHAVVYGRPALAVPVTQVHADVSTEWLGDGGFVLDDLEGEGWQDSILIEAPDISLHTTLGALQAEQPAHPLAAAILGTLEAVAHIPHPSPSPIGAPAGVLREGEGGNGIGIRVTSTIPVASGLGSGAAVSVALIRSLSAFLGQPLGDENVNAIAFEVEKLHHGTPSGIDNTVITYARPVYFAKSQPIELLQVRQPFALVIGDTGVPAPTKESVGDVRRLWEADEARWEAVFNEVAELVENARLAIESGKTEELGPLMDANHALLQQLTVSSPELDRLVLAARSAGAAGAKMSGGGRGGNMIALVGPGSAESVSSSLIKAGAVRTILTTVQ
jgi:mevalonate kinase